MIDKSIYQKLVEIVLIITKNSDKAQLTKEKEREKEKKENRKKRTKRK